MIGKTVSHYRIIEKLGQGGMGEVYRAEDTNLHRQVAIKALPDEFAHDEERLARFQREAEVLSSLNHTNIASLYGLEESDGKRFIVMELVDGETLAHRLLKGRLPLEDALQVCRQVAEGLEAAHEKGVIHRDLKPGNVMITADDKVKILDFGLAKALAAESVAAIATQSPTITEAMTRPGIILGTAAYMSPEQAKGKPVDKRADIWAFGCILYECLTGKRGFQGDTITETVAAILKGEPEWTFLPAETPAIMRSLLRRCLQKDSGHRLHDIADARLDIEEAKAPPFALTGVPSSTHISRRQVLLVGLGALVLGTTIAAVAVWYLKPQPPAVQPPVRLVVTLPPGDRLPTANFPPLSLSPNGRLLAYVAIHGGVQQLYVRPLEGFEAKPLPGTEGAEEPFFSPDGEWIGFFAGGRLKKVSVAGRTTLTLCDAISGAGATWGSDEKIIFCPSVQSGLLRVSANGGKPEVLTNPDRARGENSHRWPQLLPGGKALLFTIMSGFGWDESKIALLRLDTGEIRTVLGWGHTGRFVPTGHLTYYRAGTLLAVPFDLARLAVTSSTPVAIVEGVPQGERTGGAEYSISSSGSLAYIPANRRQFERQLAWVDRNGAVEPLPAPPLNYRNLSLSPDGRLVALTVTSGTRDIWIYDLERRTLTRLATESGVSNPIWTPDGKRITYRGLKEGRRNLFWKLADGSGSEERLTTSESPQNVVSWSPDGQWLSFIENTLATSYDIWMLRLDGERRPQPFLQTQFDERNAIFSPDGHWLAYQSAESGRFEVYIQPFPGPGGKWRVSTEGGSEPRWARNGHELFYRDGNKMMAVDIKTGPTFAAGKHRILFEGQFLAYDVSLDSQRFLMIQAVELEQPATQINLVLNWFEELKSLVPTGKR